jgi:EmrB/QacA subfamily drug resistance transporter
MTISTSAPVTDRRLTFLSLVLALGMFVTLLDTTVVNIALETLRSAFGATVGQTQWVATAYLLALAAVIPISGWVSEKVGARNAWLAAIALFLVGSVLCGLATSLPALIAFRVVQGIGAGLVMSITLSIATRAAGPARVGRATAIVALPGLLGSILGNVLGGVILEGWSWNWLFFINIPICLIALVAGTLLLPETPPLPGHRLDVLGFLLLTPGVVALAFGVSNVGGALGLAAPDVWIPLALSVALIVAFTAHSLGTRRTPLIDVRVFARRSFGVGSLITFFAGFSTYALSFLLPLFYQQVRGDTVLNTGLILIASGVGTMFFVIALRPLTTRVDGRFVIAAGIALTMLGTVPFALAGADGSTFLLLAGQFAQGVGFAATTFPVLALALANLSHDEAPHGSAAFTIVQRIGAPFGVAVVAVILQNILASGTGDGTEAFNQTFWWVFGLSAIPLVLAFFLPGKNAVGASEPAH